jgi:hypothetical protein
VEKEAQRAILCTQDLTSDFGYLRAVTLLSMGSAEKKSMIKKEREERRKKRKEKRLKSSDAEKNYTQAGANLNGIFKKGIVIRRCEGCGRDINVTDDESRKLCYSCQLMETRRRASA